MDNKDFFIGATLRICSSLEIEKALWKCLMYIRDYMPADQLHITHHDLKNKIVNVIASATVDGGTIATDQIPMARDYFKWMENLKDVWIANDVENHYMMKHYLNYLDRNSSMVNLRLIIGEQFIGALNVFAQGKNRYTEDHAKFLALLKEPFGIALANSLKHREVLKLQDKLKDHNRYLQTELLRISGDDIIGKNAGLRGVMEAVNQVAPLQTPVLLIGDTGTGKEVIANAIHILSPRKDGPFIKVNCGAIPETIIDSELFGHERGAFTGAIAQKRGHFERAHEGTILLDEIGELPQDAQLRMLRVLQDKEIYRVGGSKPIKVNIRLIAATHRNLEDLVQREKFRRDLYFRLRVFPIIIPPLRQRKSDIPNLTQYFIVKKSQEMGITGPFSLATGALDDLINYDWPGNVRELENAVERALILRKSRILDFKDIINPFSPDIPGNSVPKKNKWLTMDQLVAEEIAKVLAMTGGKVEGKNGAAEILGLKPNTLRSRMKKMGIPFGRHYTHEARQTQSKSLEN
jgi:transcriptional regulator with GAF, ATPase, and Fis domain